MMRALAVSLLLLAAGCAANAQTRPAYVNVNALMPHDPLYGTLAQYDRQIAALSATLHTRFADTPASIQNATAAIRTNTQTLTQTYQNHQAPPGVMLRYRSTPEVPRAPGANPATPYTIEQSIASTYTAQHADLQTAAQRDMAQYRSALQAQEQHAYAAFADSVTERSQQAIAKRAQGLRERESNLLLELARKNAPQRLLLRAKLLTLALDAPTRARFRSRLRALQAQENDALQAARRIDAATLQAYAAQVQARAQSDLAHMQTQLASRSAANLAARERVLQSQISSTAALPFYAAPASQGAPADMQTAYQALTAAQMPDAGAFAAARDDLTAHWNALRKADAGDTAQTRSQIAWLRHDREAVRKRIVAQILYEAGKIAKARGYSEALPGQAPPGAPDLTPSVQSALQSLSP